MSARGQYSAAQKSKQKDGKQRQRRPAIDQGALPILRLDDYTEARRWIYEEVLGWRRYRVMAPQRLSAMERAGQISPYSGPTSIEYGPRERTVDNIPGEVLAEYAAAAAANESLLDETGAIPPRLVRAFLRYVTEVNDRVEAERAWIRSHLAARPQFACDCRICRRLNPAEAR